MPDSASITLSNGAVVREGPWRCFHCDEVFDSPVCAERHFGMDEMHTPACKIKGLGETALLDALRAALKERDEAWSRMGHEDTDTMRVLYSMQSDRHQALIREEQRGYDKGLADGRAEAALAQPARAQAGVAKLVARWRAEAKYLHMAAEGMHGMMRSEERADTLDECADALAALNGGEDG